MHPRRRQHSHTLEHPGVVMRTVTLPYLPVVAWISYSAFDRLGRGGLVPVDLTHPIARWLVVLWTALLAFGGLACVVGAMLDQKRVEAAGLAFIVCGMLFYGVVAAAFHYEEHPGPTVLAVFAFSLMGLFRLYVLSLLRRAEGLVRRMPTDSAGE